MSLPPQDTLPRELHPFQNFWRCAHHPSALENFEARRTTCEFECHCQPLRWYHNGTQPLPPSWGGR